MLYCHPGLVFGGRFQAYFLYYISLQEKGLEGYMNRLSLVLISTVAFMFAACGDSGDGASPHSNADMDVQTYSELPSCAEKRDGKTAYVADQEQGYICQNGKWVEDDDVKVVSVTQSEVEGFLTDSRDGQTYRTVTIGFQTWMAENLNYKTANSYCYDNNANNCTKYGRLYTWNAAKTACPSGWHLPTQAEMKTLIATVGGANDASSLKSTSGWKEYSRESGNGTDDFSFSALPAGVRDTNGKFYSEGIDAFFWSSTEDPISNNKAYLMNLYYYNGDGAMLVNDSKDNGFSVRCVKDGSSNKVVASSSSVVKASSSSVVQNEVLPSTVAIGSLTDSRDGKKYKTVTIGSQTWMAQNLNYEIADSYCYDDNTSSCTKYGRLYTWAAAKKSCPSGWHLPTRAEFETLISAVGGQFLAGKKLKSTSGWNSGGNGTDDYSFSALPAGFWNVGYDGGVDGGNRAYFWSSTENYSYGYGMSLFFNADEAYLYEYDEEAYSIRCIKDNASSSGKTSSSSAVIRSSSSIKVEVKIGSITDSRDGQTYKTVTIGTQTWMAQNLNYETADSYCYGDTPSNCTKYGRLYTWAAATTACPSGWHLPTKAEFETLITAVGGSSTAGTKLKSTSGWTNSGNGTDDYSFSALPAGFRNYYGDYYYEGDFAYFWSSTEINSNYAYFMNLYYDTDDAYLFNNNEYNGFSVRCLKD